MLAVYLINKAMKLKHKNGKMEKYDSMPTGWTITKTATMAPTGYVMISNNKSRFNGQREIGLLKLTRKQKK